MVEHGGHTLGRRGRTGTDRCGSAGNIHGGLHGLFGELAHLVGDDGKPPSLFPGPRRFDGGIQRQQVGLAGDFLDESGDILDFGRLVAQLKRHARNFVCVCPHLAEFVDRLADRPLGFLARSLGGSDRLGCRRGLAHHGFGRGLNRRRRLYDLGRVLQHGVDLLDRRVHVGADARQRDGIAVGDAGNARAHPAHRLNHGGEATDHPVRQALMRMGFLIGHRLQRHGTINDRDHRSVAFEHQQHGHRHRCQGGQARRRPIRQAQRGAIPDAGRHRHADHHRHEKHQRQPAPIERFPVVSGHPSLLPARAHSGEHRD